MKQPVPTKKPKIATYLNVSLYEKVKKEAERTGFSISKWVANLIERYFFDEIVTLEFDPETLKEIKKQAVQEVRSLEDQIHYFIKKSLADKEN